MANKELEQEYEDQIDNIDLEAIDFGDDEEVLPEKIEDDTENKEIEVPVVDNSLNEELVKLRADLESERNRATKAEKEREEAWTEADKVKTETINGAINQWGNQISKLQQETAALYVEYERAKSESEWDKAQLIATQYNEKNSLVNQLNGNIQNAKQQLANKTIRKSEDLAPTKEETPKRTSAQLMADKWALENSWFNDPAHNDKRKIVEATIEEAIKSKYDASSLAFWRHVDNKVAEFEAKKTTPRRSPPAIRPSGVKSGVQKVVDKKNADAEALAKTNDFFLINEISAATIGKKEFDARRKRVYLSTLKHLNKGKLNA